jgi:hypothetical protein
MQITLLKMGIFRVSVLAIKEMAMIYAGVKK